MAYEKLLNEIYAVVSLKYLWPEYRPGFVKSESPDWINEAMELTVEVSQALLPDDGETKSFLERYLGHRREELPAFAFARYGDRLHFYNDRFWAVLPVQQSSQMDRFKAEYRFDRKLEKLNAHYQHRKRNGLYLYLHPTGENPIDAQRLFSYMKSSQSSAPVRFDLVFLNGRGVIYVCDFAQDTVTPIPYPENAAAFLDEEAERLRHLGPWENGTPLDR